MITVQRLSLAEACCEVGEGDVSVCLCREGTLTVSEKKQQEGKRAMRRVVRVLDDGGSSVNALLLVELHQEGERGSNSSAGCLHHSCLAVFVVHGCCRSRTRK